MNKGFPGGPAGEQSLVSFNDAEGNPAALGAAASPGVSQYAARRDHVHPYPTAAQVGAIPNDGWLAAIGGSWAFSSADAPSFVVNVPDADAVLMSVGYRIRLVHSSTTKYFIVTAKGASSGGATPITFYGGTDYTLTNSALTNTYYSPVKVPLGFPADPDKWTVSLISNTSNLSQSSPTSNTWYNLGSISGAIPIGVWRVYIEVAMEVNATLAAATNVGYRVTLSTASNSESDSGFTAVKTSAMPVITGGTDRTSFHREKVLALSSKTTYFLNGLTGMVGATSINFRGDVVATIVKCVCAYL